MKVKNKTEMSSRQQCSHKYDIYYMVDSSDCQGEVTRTSPVSVILRPLNRVKKCEVEHKLIEIAPELPPLL